MGEVNRNQDIPSVEQVSPENNEVKEIKPEGEMTFQDAQEFWNNYFASEIKECSFYSTYDEPVSMKEPAETDEPIAMELSKPNEERIDCDEILDPDNLSDIFREDCTEKKYAEGDEAPSTSGADGYKYCIDEADKSDTAESQLDESAGEKTEGTDNGLEPNSKYEIGGDVYETDDNGNIYKKNGDLMPNTTYEKNGVTYTTDDKGRINTWQGEPKYDPDNERDEGAQTESGGEDRKEGDDGGHLMARILGGSSGSENIVPMRDTVNRGDYKKSENEIAEAKKQGKDVQDSGNVIYEGDSSRPTKIERTYIVNGEKSVLKVDNVEGSKDLLADVENSISDEDMDSLKNEIADMKEDECEVSVTSVLKKYDEDGNLVSVRVGTRNETTGEKSYKTYEPRKEG